MSYKGRGEEAGGSQNIQTSHLQHKTLEIFDNFFYPSPLEMVIPPIPKKIPRSSCLSGKQSTNDNDSFNT